MKVDDVLKDMLANGIDLSYLENIDPHISIDGL